MKNRITYWIEFPLENSIYLWRRIEGNNFCELSGNSPDNWTSSIDGLVEPTSASSLFKKVSKGMAKAIYPKATFI